VSEGEQLRGCGGGSRKVSLRIFADAAIPVEKRRLKGVAFESVGPQDEKGNAIPLTGVIDRGSPMDPDGSATLRLFMRSSK
jgi:hypothetical protein